MLKIVFAWVSVLSFPCGKNEQVCDVCFSFFALNLKDEILVDQLHRIVFQRNPKENPMVAQIVGKNKQKPDSCHSYLKTQWEKWTCLEWFVDLEL